MQRASSLSPAYLPALRGDHWQELGAVPPLSVHDARLQLHHAAQIANSVGTSLLPARADDSHTALDWSDALEGFVTPVIPAPKAFRVGLRVSDLSMRMLAPDGKRHESFHLSGSTVDDAFRWLVAQVKAAGADTTRMTLRKHYEIPAHAVATGDPFALHGGADFAEIARYYSNAHRLLASVSSRVTDASPIRCWPHHFDLATLIPLDSVGRTIGVGMSPGDGSFDQPYFYVGPNPPPPTSALPSLTPPAQWHTEGWVGAWLAASDIVTEPDASQQEARVRRFADEAVAACRALMQA